MRSKMTFEIKFTSLVNKNAMINRNVMRKRKSDEDSDQAVDKTAANVHVRLFCGYY